MNTDCVQSQIVSFNGFVLLLSLRVCLLFCVSMSMAMAMAMSINFVQLAFTPYVEKHAGGAFCAACVAVLNV